MDNYEIAKNFSLLGKLMDIHGENSFKAKSYSVAAFNIEKLTEELSKVPHQKIFSFHGIGEAIGKKIIELLETGSIKNLEALKEKTPEGILEMMRIKGIGPKKINIIWKEMGIENVGELLYACHENRLSLYKGFGEKTQNNVAASIQFYQDQQGNYLYAQLEKVSAEIFTFLEKAFGMGKVLLTGAFLRQEEIIKELEYAVAASFEKITEEFSASDDLQIQEVSPASTTYKLSGGIKIRLYPASSKDLIETGFRYSGSEEFYNAMLTAFPAISKPGVKDDSAIFEKIKLQYIPPPLRESAGIIQKARDHAIPELIQPEDIKGIIHCHSNWSDGIHTIEQLADACIEAGLEYLVLSDHSKAAFYAKGLTEEQIISQHEVVDDLNKKYSPGKSSSNTFKIFKSIESDILNDGSLDYSNDVLSSFDLVIASVHSNLKMNEEKAMKRLMAVIENPYTVILGHMTGRLLLSRNGFPVDYKKIIDACASNHVVIEVNAHPRRLDMKWQWIPYALEKGVLISIDPDAHSIEEFKNTRYGVLTAQKGMLTKEKNLSSFSLAQFEKFLSDIKKKKGLA